MKHIIAEYPFNTKIRDRVYQHFLARGAIPHYITEEGTIQPYEPMPAGLAARIPLHIKMSDDSKSLWQQYAGTRKYEFVLSDIQSQLAKNLSVIARTLIISGDTIYLDIVNDSEDIFNKIITSYHPDIKFTWEK